VFPHACICMRETVGMRVGGGVLRERRSGALSLAASAVASRSRGASGPKYLRDRTSATRPREATGSRLRRQIENVTRSLERGVLSRRRRRCRRLAAPLCASSLLAGRRHRFNPSCRIDSLAITVLQLLSLSLCLSLTRFFLIFF